LDQISAKVMQELNIKKKGGDIYVTLLFWDSIRGPSILKLQK
jgi:hypothetical protein